LASDRHFERTGKRLKITEAAILYGKYYEEEDEG
jgi:hypothetical protein